MPNKRRDYKAEYAAAKRRATRAGYKSEREYKAVRKQLKLPPRTSPIPRRVLARTEPELLNDATHAASRMSRLRRESRNWSLAHSLVGRSRYTSSMSDDQVIAYHAAYVERPQGSRRERSREKRRRIRDYLRTWFGLSNDEWTQQYGPIS